MSQHPSAMRIRRILLVSLLPGAVIVALQSAWLAVQLPLGYRAADPGAEIAIGLVIGVLAWVGTAAVLMVKARHQA